LQTPPSASAASPPSELKDFVVKRDGNRPISFTGEVLAKVEMASSGATTLTAALYKARGGKFVATLAKRKMFAPALELEGIESVSEEFDWARVFDNHDEALAWFRPEPLTGALRQQLGCCHKP
jgi:hypothetical protein